MEATLKLELATSANGIKLVKIEFCHPLKVLRKAFPSAVHLKSPHQRNAVKGLALLLCGTALRQSEKFVLRGDRFSQAQALAHAVTRAHNWLTGIFGRVATGQPFVQYLIKTDTVQNDSTRQTQVCLNTSMIPAENIYVSLDGRNIIGAELQNLVSYLGNKKVTKEELNP